jgi:hypothetical protein
MGIVEGFEKLYNLCGFPRVNHKDCNMRFHSKVLWRRRFLQIKGDDNLVDRTLPLKKQFHDP